VSFRAARPFSSTAVLLLAGALLGGPAVGLSLLGSAPAQAVVAGQDALSATLGSDGHLALNATLAVANGSPLRYAMDGDFTPLVNAMPVNATTRAAILARIAAAETSPAFAPFFGNRDGVVEPSEVALFAYFVGQGSRFVPSGFFSASALFAVRLDGNAPTGGSLGSVAFTDAAGPDASVAPLGIETGVSLVFPYAGNGHALSVRWAAATVGPAPTPGTLSVSFRTPPGEAVTGTSGFVSASVSNDPLGWAPATVSGSASLAQSGNLTVSFDPAFPLGYVLVGVGVAAAAGVVVWRDRRRRRAPVTRARPTDAEPDPAAAREASERRSGSA
jgi:hypothetical protein